MKKFSAVVFTILFFSGCFFSAEKTLQNGDAPSAEDFDKLVSQSREELSAAFLAKVPTLKLPKISETKFVGNLNFAAPALLEFALNLTSEGKSDFSDAKISAEGRTNFTVEIKKQAGENLVVPPGKIAGKILSKVFGDEVFYQLSNLQIEIEGAQNDVATAIVSPFVGKWFGGKLENLERIFNENGVPVENLEKIYQNLSNEDLLQIRAPLAQILEKSAVLKMESAEIVTENIANFKVSLDREKMQILLDEIFSIYERKLAQQNFDENLKTEIENNFAAQKTAVEKYFDEVSFDGNLAITVQNPSEFTLAGKIKNTEREIDLNLKNSATRFSFEISGENKVALTLDKKDGGDFSFATKLNEMKLAKCFLENGKFNFEILRDGVEKLIAIDLQKYDKDFFAGEIKFSADSNLPKLQIEKLKIAESEKILTAKIDSQNLTAALNLQFLTEEISPFKVLKPDSFESFETLVTEVRKVFFAPVE